jgi:RNA polymerase sigma-70 factor (ECF subfamily)
MSSVLDDVLLLTKIATYQQEGPHSKMVKEEAAEAIGELYDRYARLVYSLARSIVIDEMIAEEITQDVFLQIWNKAGFFRSENGRVITWLSSITRYRAFDILRRQKARPEGHNVELHDDFFLEEHEDFGIELSVDTLLERQQVRRALQELPEEQRKALSLAYFQGMTQEEIAAALNEPLGTIKTRIRLGMQKLRHALADKNKNP